jgi:outer membrane protein
VSFDRSYKLARDDGPNLAVAQATIDQFKLDALRAKRNTLPTLNANGGPRLQLLRLDRRPVGHRPWSGYNWTGGLTLSGPVGHEGEPGPLPPDRVAGPQPGGRLRPDGPGPRGRGAAAVRGVETSNENVRASSENTKFAEKAYELTKAQFDAGLATSYLVLQAQNTLETARVSELQAKVNLLVAVANLRFYEGSSLQLYRINLPE